ncbi:hypothetical protein [Pseudalkalibacillus hwajinpoensis]|nr:hypothetical protein [Pseudalkalibacillus hwajinpoensis]
MNKISDYSLDYIELNQKTVNASRLWHTDNVIFKEELSEYR